MRRISRFTGEEGTVKKIMKCSQAIRIVSWLKLTYVSGTMSPSSGIESCISEWLTTKQPTTNKILTSVIKHDRQSVLRPPLRQFT
jgi:hypothetical protein